MRKLTTADLLVIQAAILAGKAPPIGTDPFSTQGLRNVDGTFNNITHSIIVDQYGNTINTDLFGVTNQPFIYFADPNFKQYQQPAGPAADYSQGVGAAGNVVDQTPRIISNFISDSNQATNPAADPADIIGNPGSAVVFATPFNSLMTIFGQFFDHGLDFIAKGGNGTVMIPLLPTDPLYVDPSSPGYIPGVSNMMMMTRATVVTPPGFVPTEPGHLGVNINTTGPLVDQSQTYGSTPATMFYLQEVDSNGVLTGRLVTHSDGGMATWADIKANAALRGIILTDADVFDIPVPVATPNPNQFAKGAGTGQAFLADIAHSADPSGGKLPDADNFINPPGAPGATYDNELLDAHYVAGDPRANENIALTAVHEVFHGEHNRLVAQIKDLIQQQDQLTPGFAVQWDGAKIFEAAKFANEMQYQHMVFEEFARRVSPNVDAFANYDVTLNPNVTSEFANAVYRLGHSMLTDTVDMVNGADQKTSISLVQAFLNPVKFGQVGAADINKGMSQQEGNLIDEFVVDGVRNMLLGLPLDLATLNIARGRDTGVPTLNELRADLFAQTNLLELRPYTSWADFGGHLLHPASLVNFIAAYATSDAGIVTARNNGNYDVARALAQAHIDANDSFMTGADAGYQDIDLWIGGLAEAKVLAGGISEGMLGSTFDFVFATQMLALQNGDRLYYLARLAGNILDEVEQQTFADLVQRGSHATHINGDTFGTADAYIELSNVPGGNLVKTPTEAAAVYHEVIGGTHAANAINAGNGNDTVYGEGGDDIIEGGLGKDRLYGGDGNDFITDAGGDELIRGGTGHDTINAGTGIDVVFGNEGNDTVNLGIGDDSAFGGTGNDHLFGDNGNDALAGDEGDDILDGGIGNDALDGGSGNDVLVGGAGVDTLLGAVGNDFLVGGAGADVLDGGLGLGEYDVASYETAFATAGAPGLTINLLNPLLSTGDALGDTYIDIEEIRGSIRNDNITGDALANVLSGKEGNDVLSGGDGDDALFGGAGNDNLIGGLGIDTAVFSGNRGEYDIVGFTVVHARPVGASDGTDTFISNDIEVVEFADESFNFATLLNLPFINLTNTAAFEVPDFDGAGVAVAQHLVPLVKYVGGPGFPGLVDNTALADHVATNGVNLGVITVNQPSGPAGLRTFALAGADALSFQIVTNLLGEQELHFIGGGPLSRINYEAKTEYNVTISVTDGNGSTALNIVVPVQDVNDNAPVITTGNSVNVQHGTSTSTVIYRAESEDLDTVHTLPGVPNDGSTYVQYSLAPDLDFADFTFTNGELRFLNSPDVDAPADGNGDNIYEVNVRAFDGTHTTTQLVKIQVQGAGETWIGDGGGPTPTADNHTGTSFGDTLLGLTLTDQLFGAGGNDVIDGGTGDDVLDGGPGNDLLDGGLGTDTVSYAAAVVGVNIQLHTNVVDATAAGLGFDTLISIENATGGSGPDQFWGNASSNTFVGGDGNDWMHGFGGTDTLLGGLGSDQLLGGDGADTLNGEDGDDFFWIDEFDTVQGGAGTDYAYSVTSNGISINLATSSLDGVWASNGNDTLDASSTSTQMYLIGYGGTDTITGGSGNDYIWVDFDATDTINGGAGHNELYHIGAGAVTINLATINVQAVLGGAQGDTLDASGLNVFANIHGLGGNDIITGGAAGDYLYGYDGDDTFRGNDGNDWIDGGIGTQDTALYAGVQADYTIVNLGGGIWSVANGSFTDTLIGVERVQFDGGGLLVL
jgi:Ca2+-binding RTX toxin-like protein